MLLRLLALVPESWTNTATAGDAGPVEGREPGGDETGSAQWRHGLADGFPAPHHGPPGAHGHGDRHGPPLVEPHPDRTAAGRRPARGGGRSRSVRPGLAAGRPGTTERDPRAACPAA